MYIFTQTVHQIGGGTSEGVLMRATSDKKRIEIRQYFERHGFEDIEFARPKDFCDFLAKKYYKDGRQVFFMEQPNSHDYFVYSTWPAEFKGYENEIGLMGVLRYIGGE